MNKGDLYVTPNNQHRIIIGNTPQGDVAFATRGGNTSQDYNHCQIQPPAIFAAQGTFSGAVALAELARVEALFANYIDANGIR